MDITTMRIVVTLASMAALLASGSGPTRRNQERFDEAAQLPFKQD
jgi:cytochrome c oxidase cbb3-type subunit 4